MMVTDAVMMTDAMSNVWSADGIMNMKHIGSRGMPWCNPAECRHEWKGVGGLEWGDCCATPGSQLASLFLF